MLQQGSTENFVCQETDKATKQAGAQLCQALLGFSYGSSFK